MDIEQTIRETLEDNCEQPDIDWIMLTDPTEMARLIHRRIKKDLGATQEKLQKDLNMARGLKTQAEKREAALEETVLQLTELLKSQEVLDD